MRSKWVGRSKPGRELDRMGICDQLAGKGEGDRRPAPGPDVPGCPDLFVVQVLAFLAEGRFRLEEWRELVVRDPAVRDPGPELPARPLGGGEVVHHVDEDLFAPALF